MKFGVLFLASGWKGTPDKEVYHQVLEQAEAAEELGFDSVWLTEHHFTQYGRPGLSPMAAAIAMRTRRVRIGTAVYLLPIHHPLDIAEEAAVVDILSNGRLDFGVGRGYQPEELLVYGADPATIRERHNEALEIIRAAWLNGEIEYDGRFWKIPRREFRPLPLQKPHPPIWQPIISSGSYEEAVRLGKNAIFGLSLIPLKSAEHYYKTWRGTLSRLGASREAFRDMCVVMVHVAETDAEARANSEESCIWLARMFGSLIEPARAEFKKQLAELSFQEIYENRSLIGSAERVLEGTRWLRDLGCSQMVAFMNFGDLEHKKVLRSMELFAKTVFPAVRGHGHS